jgi:hypothetical protein
MANMEQVPSSPTWQTFPLSWAAKMTPCWIGQRGSRRLHLPADQQFSRPESELVRTLYDCPDVAVGQRCRVGVATHPAHAHKSRVGLTRSGLVYELFFTHLPQDALTASDVVALAPLIVALLNQCWPMKTRSILTIVHKYVVEGYKEPHLPREW